jgi:hypothetical protein
VSIVASTLVAIAAVLAEYADHATGRNVAVTNAVVAARVGCSPRTVTTARRVLAAGGWAIEAVRGHGSATTPSVGNRPSIWHLIGRRAVEFFHLPPKAGLSSSSPVRTHSPSAPAGAPESQSATTSARTRRRWRTAPRPLAMQRLAAELVCPRRGDYRALRGLHRGHIGAVCDALTAAGIDPRIWSARAIIDGLDADMRERGWSWPDHIERSGAFLASRLRRLTSKRTDESSAAGGIAASLGKTPTPPLYVSQPVAVLTTEQRTTINRLRTQIRYLLSESGVRRSAAAEQPRVPVSHPAATGSCAACGTSGAPRRKFMPTSRTHLCDPCWTASRRRRVVLTAQAARQGLYAGPG